MFYLLKGIGRDKEVKELNCMKCESVCEQLNNISFICLVCGDIYEQSVLELNIGNSSKKYKGRKKIVEGIGK